jgi:hypothetical protein
MREALDYDAQGAPCAPDMHGPPPLPFIGGTPSGEGWGEGGSGDAWFRRTNPLPPFGHPLPEGEGHQNAARGSFFGAKKTPSFVWGGRSSGFKV